MIRLFLSYSHKDEDLRKELEKHLAALRRDGVIDIWQDRRIGPGDEFGREISNQLESADIVLLLVSSDFLHSDYCYDIEMKRAMERQIDGSARVIPVILRPCDWQKTPLGKLNATPTDGKPVTEHASLDRGFLEIAHAVRTAVESFHLTSPVPDEHAAARDLGTHPADRSSNLRIKKQFSDRDRHRFLEEGFEYIARYFENSLKELEARNSEVETRFKRIDANRFEAVAYVNGDEQSRCGIWLGGISRTDNLLFSYDGVGNGNSYNESISVDNNGYTLFFEPLGMAHFGQNRDNELTHEGAAEYFWGLFIDRLQ